MMTPGQIHDALQDRRIERIAQSTGIHYNTIRKLRDDPSANPTWRVIKLISDYLEGRSDD